MSVSRALRGLPGVSVETRAHVLNVASELGYHTNELARILRTGATSGLVGLVVTNLANPFYSQLATGVEDTIKEHGLQVILGNTNEDSDRERQLFADLMERRVDGIVVVPAATTDRSHYAAAARVVPLVFAARPPLGIAADSVLVDDVGGARQATEALLAAGHRRIGFIGNPPRVFTGGQRFKGYASALAAAGIDVSPSLVSRVSTTVAAATHATARVLNESSPPSALFTANNQLTLGALLAVRGRERPPLLAGFDDLEFATLLRQPPILVRYDAREVGRCAGRLLLARLGAGIAPFVGKPVHVVVPVAVARPGAGSHHQVTRD